MEGLGDSLHGQVAQNPFYPPPTHTRTPLASLLAPLSLVRLPTTLSIGSGSVHLGGGGGSRSRGRVHAHTRSALRAGAKLRCMRGCTQVLSNQMVHVSSKRVWRWSVPSGRSSVMMKLAAFSTCCFLIRLRGDFSVANLVETLVATRLATDSLRGREAR